MNGGIFDCLQILFLKAPCHDIPVISCMTVNRHCILTYEGILNQLLRMPIRVGTRRRITSHAARAASRSVACCGSRISNNVRGLDKSDRSEKSSGCGGMVCVTRRRTNRRALMRASCLSRSPAYYGASKSSNNDFGHGMRPTLRSQKFSLNGGLSVSAGMPLPGGGRSVSRGMRRPRIFVTSFSRVSLGGPHARRSRAARPKLRDVAFGVRANKVFAADRTRRVGFGKEAVREPSPDP